jgi:hypothetical protein
MHQSPVNWTGNLFRSAVTAAPCFSAHAILHQFTHDPPPPRKKGTGSFGKAPGRKKKPVWCHRGPAFCRKTQLPAGSLDARGSRPEKRRPTARFDLYQCEYSGSTNIGLGHYVLKEIQSWIGCLSSCFCLWSASAWSCGMQKDGKRSTGPAQEARRGRAGPFSGATAVRLFDSNQAELTRYTNVAQHSAKATGSLQVRGVLPRSLFSADKRNRTRFRSRAAGPPDADDNTMWGRNRA